MKQKEQEKAKRKLMKKSKLIKILNYYTDEGDKKPKETKK